MWVTYKSDIILQLIDNKVFNLKQQNAFKKIEAEVLHI